MVVVANSVTFSWLPVNCEAIAKVDGIHINEEEIYKESVASKHILILPSENKLLD